MENKNLIIIAVVIVVIIAIAGVMFASGFFDNGVTRHTSPFKNDFMEGKFTGDVKLSNDTSDFMQSYYDKENDIMYNVSTVDNSTALMDIYYVQGVTNPEHRTFNGNDWNIYFTQAVQGNDSNSNNGKMNIIICQSQGEKQGYLIYMIIGPKTKLNVTLNAYGDTYKEYVEPLLESVTLKESKNVPAIYEEFGLSEDQFAEQMEMVRQYKSGNLSALDGGAQ